MYAQVNESSEDEDFLAPHSAPFLLLCSYGGSIGLNLTNTFLVFLEDDIGDLLKIHLTWEGDTGSFNSIWKNVKKSFWGYKAKPILQIRRIRVKAGETQKK